MQNNWKRSPALRSMLVGAILLTALGLAARAADVPPPRTVSIVNPAARARVSGTFNVQVRVFDPAGLTGVVVELSTNGGSTYTQTLTKSPNYTFSTANTAIYEKQIPSLSGAYTLVARSTTTGNVRTTSTSITVTVVAAKTGDGTLVRRDNSSQLCSDCHNIPTHSSETTTGNHGTWSTNCRDCHTPHVTTNSFLVSNKITPPGGSVAKDVYFSKKTGVATNPGATDKANASYVNPDITGPCQVCHTLTSRYTSSALGATSHKGNCSDCHKHTEGFKGNIGNCTGCHGDVNRTGANVEAGADVYVAAAPPTDADEVSPGTLPTDPQVGAHLKHVNNLSSTLRQTPIACSECHGDPFSPHALPAPGIGFGTLAKTAWTGQPAVNPQYDVSNAAAPKCNNTYCHGAFTGGNYTQMTWNVPSGGSLSCTTCHALPPANAAHQPTVDVPDPTQCGACHPGYTNAIVAKATHIDGFVNLNNCTQCHGDPNRTVYPGTETEGYVKGAPPLDSNKGTTSPKIGSHIPHVNQLPANAKGSALSRWCDNCHPASTPLDPGHQTDHNTLPVFGNLSNAGGASPVYGYVDPAANRVPTSMTCSMTYCHGQFPYGRKELNVPYWGQGTAGASCGSCHLLAPPLSHPQNTNCALCHGTGYDSVAQTVVASTHVDGQPTMVAGRTGCVACHGDPNAVLAVTGGTTDTNWKGAPPYGTRNETTTTTRAVGAHAAHVNANRLRTNALPCTECHPDRSADTTAAHATGTVENAWGILATNNNTVIPTKTAWNGTTLTCGNYCHGSTLVGGNRKPASWVGGAAQAACDSCHANSFPTPPVAATNYHPQNTTCSGCHGSGFANATTVDKATHLDRTKTFSPARTGACNKCHGAADGYATGGETGTDPNVIAAPGLNAGAMAASNRSLAGDVHKAHVNDGASSASVAYHCTECHGADKANAADHANGTGWPASTAEFGTIAKSGGMTSPSYDSVAHTCSGTYCHSKYTTPAATPNWTSVGQLPCTACHPNAFASPAAPYYHPQNTACTQCHGTGYTSSTVVDATAKPTHVDGTVTLPARTGACNKCHGAPDGYSTGGEVGTDPNVIAAPGLTGAVAASNRGLSGDVHKAHVNDGTNATTLPFHCTECHGADKLNAGDHANGTGWPASPAEFGTITKSGGMTSPSYDPVAHTCSNTYCHSKYTIPAATPNWTSGGQLLCTACHPNSFSLPSAQNPNYHPQNTACTQCHGTGYTNSTTVDATARATHVDAILTFSPARTGGCNKCHGFADGYVVNTNAGGTADPAAIAAPGTAAMTTSADPGQGIAGAHAAHVNQSVANIQYMGAIHCTECHGADKASAADHANGDARPDWSQAIITKYGNMTNPQYDPITGACTNTYCHTKYAVTPFVPANLPDPAWQTAGKLWCNACHGDPPAFNSNGTTAHPQGNNSCSTCHPQYGDKVAGDSRPRAVNLSAHVNGVVTGASGCTGCHGGTNAGNPTGNAAPPLGAANPGTQETLTTEPAVGAHQKHLMGGSIRLAMQCSDCHPSYSDSTHSSPPYGYNWQWSILTTNNNVLSPTYNTTGTDYNCSNVYCHGAVTNTTTQPGATHPVAKWTGGAAEVSCTSCHGSPPPLLTSYHPANAACSDCHGTGYTSATALAGPPATHVDRNIDLPNRTGSCNRCHGFTDVGSPGGFVAAAAGSAANAIAAPGTPATTASAAGAHTAHVNQGNSPVMPPIACGECHGAAETTAADHVDGNGAPQPLTDWGTIAKGGALNKSPSYSGGTCTNTYCHNQYTSNPTPSWTSTIAKPGCTSCHANSFPLPSLTNNWHPANPTCSSCHGAAYTSATTLDPSARTTHIADTAPTLPSRTGTCNKCHGSLDGYVVNTNGGGTADAMRVIGAPGTPARATGTDPGQGVAGAHQAHVNQAGDGTTTFQYMKPIACTECHGAQKSSGSDHADGTVNPDMVSASLIADLGMSPTPAYVNSGGTAGTCTNTYCHSKYAVTPYAAANLPPPTWQSTGGKLWCNACHDDPPAYEVTSPTTRHSTSPDCGTCHAGYGAKGADSRPRAVNLLTHIDGIVQKATASGGGNCNGCHEPLVTAMSAGNASGYHHLMQNSDATPLTGVGQSGNKYPNAGGDAASTNRRCLLCHADHDLFSDVVNTNVATNARARNLRTDIAVTALSGTTGAGYTNTDYDGTLPNGGICVSCHTSIQTKSYTQRDGSGTTMAVPKAGYEGSVHNYYATSTFRSDGSTFNANCSKCHGDRSAVNQSTAAPRQFSLHDSPQRRMTNPINDAVVTGTATGTQGANVFVDTNTVFPLDAYNGMAITVWEEGVAGSARTNIIKATRYAADGTQNPNSLVMVKPWVTLPISGGANPSRYVINDPMEERVCTQCHSGGAPGLDAFNTPATSYRSGQQMTGKAKTFDQYLKIYGVGTIAIAANTGTVTGTSTSWITASGTSTGISATFTHDQQTVQFSAALPADSTWLGRSIKDGQAGRGTVRWYSIVGMSADKTQLIISPPYFQATTAGVTTWAVSFGDWYLQCGTDTGWYRINDVTSGTAATIYPNYGGAACNAGSQYVMRSVPGHPLALTAAVHKPDETTVQGWNDPGASSTRPRHVTCVDCHNTHDASVGNHTVGLGHLGNTNAGVPGVTVTYPTPRTLTGIFTTNSRNITGITGGTVSSADVGKNVLCPDGTVYHIAAAPTSTSLTIGLTVGYKGTPTGSQTFYIQDPTTAPTYTPVALLTTSNWQYELCLKCHSSFAYGSNFPQSMFFSTSTLGTAATGNQTDMAKDFNPYQLAYHPIMAPGRNQPPATANPNWASSAGRKRNAPNTGLDNTFVDGWGATSRVACTDCHESESSSDPWGPHGTANQWLLKGIDPNVTVTIASGTVVYPNNCFYPGGGAAVSLVPDTGDYKNACLNCHRADVYGMVGAGKEPAGWSCNGATGTAPTTGIPYQNLSRVNHPVDGSPANTGAGHSNGVSTGALTRQGIYCMQCHGGDSLGAIHGTNSTATGTPAASRNYPNGFSYRGKRFMNGATWAATMRASTAAGVTCTTNKTLPVDTCGNNRDDFGNVANYNYDSGAD